MYYNSSCNDVKRQREYDMNEETMNIEDMDFTPEDLQNAGVDVSESTEDTETPTPDEPSTTDAGSDNTTDESEQTPNTKEELAEDEHKHDGNLKAALAQERARRKAAEERARQFEQQQKPLTLPDSEISDIREFVRREALKRFNLKAEDLESLMYEDVNKYNDFIRFEANAEYAITNKQMAVHQQRQTNMNFVNEIKSLPNFPELYQRGLEKLNEMMMREAQPINDAFYRVDIGEGTQADFDVIRKFVNDLQNEQATNTQVENNPLKVAEKLPKAGALNGGAPTPNKVSEEDILKAYQSGNIDSLPQEVRDYFNEL